MSPTLVERYSILIPIDPRTAAVSCIIQLPEYLIFYAADSSVTHVRYNPINCFIICKCSSARPVSVQTDAHVCSAYLISLSTNTRDVTLPPCTWIVICPSAGKGNWIWTIKGMGKVHSFSVSWAAEITAGIAIFCCVYLSSFYFYV
ncbi:hypothetical protein BMS3Abin16_01338 [archaeon BMS3Abin16]|nr:hypothetical protein BMS3Abin16_01338 [archaeon BMS3Abin16]